MGEIPLKIKHNFLLLTFLTFLLVMLTSCGQSNTSMKTSAEGEVYERVDIETKDRTITFEEMPERVVTLEQSATEMMLALGLEEYMVGTAFQTSEVLPGYEEAFEAIPIVADKYPSKEAFLGVNPDFAFAGINIFQENRIGTPASLEELGIKSYSLQSTNLMDATLEDVYDDVLNIGRIFKVEDRAEELIQSLQDSIKSPNEKIAPYLQETDDPIRVFAYQGGEDTPFATTQGIVKNLIEQAGGKNILDHVEEGPSANVSWEAVVDENPEVIIIFESYFEIGGEGDAEAKKEFLRQHPALSNVDAVKNDRFGVVPTVDKFEGVRVAKLYEGIAKSLYPDAFE